MKLKQKQIPKTIRSMVLAAIGALSMNVPVKAQETQKNTIESVENISNTVGQIIAIEIPKTENQASTYYEKQLERKRKEERFISFLGSLQTSQEFPSLNKNFLPLVSENFHEYTEAIIGENILNYFEKNLEEFEDIKSALMNDPAVGKKFEEIEIKFLEHVNELFEAGYTEGWVKVIVSRYLQKKLLDDLKDSTEEKIIIITTSFLVAFALLCTFFDTSIVRKKKKILQTREDLV